MSMPAIGSPRPTTLASTGGIGDSSALRGKHLLLAFFPLAFTSTCTGKFCGFTEDFTQFQSADTVVLPISVDAVPSSRSLAKEKLGVDLPSDQAREVSHFHGTLLEDSSTQPRLRDHRPDGHGALDLCRDDPGHPPGER